MVTKEEHAQRIQETIGNYFLALRSVPSVRRQRARVRT
ncbi:hypothetical protein [Novipirellula maiorica]|nr:hypothetical protein [Rhodopirellula maiorica]